MAFTMRPFPFFRVSEEQIERIQERRARIKSLLDDLGESLRLVRDLHKSSEVSEVLRACLLFVSLLCGGILSSMLC